MADAFLAKNRVAQIASKSCTLNSKMLVDLRASRASAGN